MIYCSAWAFFHFLAGSVLAVASVSYYGSAAWAIAAVFSHHHTLYLKKKLTNCLQILQFFGFSAMLVYILDAYLKFLGWKRNEKAMGGAGTAPFLTRRTENY
jgi:hypothetical protein